MNQHTRSARSISREASHQRRVHYRLQTLNRNTIEAARASRDPHMRRILHALTPHEGGLMDAIIAHADTGVPAALLAQHIALQSGLAIAELVGCCGLDHAADTHQALQEFIDVIEKTATKRLMEIV